MKLMRNLLEQSGLVSFGGFGESVGKFHTPWGVAVNDCEEIAVTECDNSRVSVFSSDGTHLRSFGSNGSDNGELSWPRGIDKSELINMAILSWPTVVTTGFKYSVGMVSF